ncbi:MAG: galactokinase [Acidobacteria bacterium]|nr:galactokinase [Acidobacteriota bacterium]
MGTFGELFGSPAAVSADAPGRVNLIGEHTDYNGGFVLPAIIPQRTRVELARRADRRVRVWSANVEPASRWAEFVIGEESPTRTWVDYVQGVTVALRRRGYALVGVDLRIESTVPLGSGLSSSAALEVSVARALRSACDLALDDVELAMVGKWAENEFVGAPTGIMDQMAVSLGQPGTALFLDTRTLGFERVPIPPSVELVVIDSGVRRRLVTSEYATRRAQCEEACRLLGVAQLRDVAMTDLPKIEALAEPFCRRARHVVTEDERVLQAVAALRANDPGQAGELFYASHASMRDDYDVSAPPVDALVEIASSDRDVYGARLTGGGFGGSIVILARAGSGSRVAARVAERYQAECAQRATVLVP